MNADARPLGISPEAFVSAFPFHIVFNRDLTVLQVGPSLQRACPEVAPGVAASTCLRVRRPLVGFDFEAIRGHQRAVFLFDVGGGKLSLRGQMIVNEAAGTVTFLGSPKIVDLSSVTSLGLSLEDFAIHDATPDLLFLLQSKNTTLADAKKLTSELTSQKAELRKANKRLTTQFAVTRILIEAPGIAEAMCSLLAAIGEGLDGAIGVWWVAERRAQVLRFGEVWRPSARRFGPFEVALRGLTVARGDGLLGQVWVQREPRWASEIEGACPIVSLAVEHGLHDAFAFPVMADEEVLGVIVFFREEASTPEKDLRQLLLDMGVKIGQVAERRRADAALRESEERYALAAEGANDGLWDWKLTTGHVYYSSRWKAMLGEGDRSAADTLDEWFKRVHPDDRTTIESELTSHIEGRTAHFEVEHRILHEDGTLRWMLARGIAVRDADGNAVRMAGTQTDVTERKLSELALFSAREDLAQKLSLVEQQERAIRELSTPIIRVWEGVLALPIIGSLDETRAAQMTERLLGELARTRASVAVLDLTGAAEMDLRMAGHLVRVMRAAHLLGSRCVVAGLSPAMARGFVELDVDISGIAFFADVKSALAWVFRGLRRRAAGAG
jgi:PAS domain S-box-containing protein